MLLREPKFTVTKDADGRPSIKLQTSLQISLYGKLITVKKGFACDGMSVPWLFQPLIGDPGFRGGFEEIKKLAESEAAKADRLTALELGNHWSAANEYCKYAGGKIGLGQPEWWKECWNLESV